MTYVQKFIKNKKNSQDQKDHQTFSIYITNSLKKIQISSFYVINPSEIEPLSQDEPRK